MKQRFSITRAARIGTKKLRSRGGFTLVEMLLAVAILSIFVAMAVVGTSGLLLTGDQMKAASKAAVLGSDVMQVVTNEVRFGDSFALNSDNEIVYNSTAYGDDCVMQVQDGQLIIVKQSPAGADSNKSFRPLGTAAYDEVRILSIEFTVGTAKDSQAVTCELSITADGTASLWKNTVTVIPLSQKTF